MPMRSSTPPTRAFWEAEGSTVPFIGPPVQSSSRMPATRGLLGAGCVRRQIQDRGDVLMELRDEFLAGWVEVGAVEALF